MLKCKLYPLCIVLLCMLSACASKKSVAYQDEFTPPPLAPAGMRVMNPYISALNEPCYSLVSLQDSFVTNGAICKRKGAWEVIPPIADPTPLASTSSNGINTVNNK